WYGGPCTDPRLQEVPGDRRGRPAAVRGDERHLLPVPAVRDRLRGGRALDERVRRGGCRRPAGRHTDLVRGHRVLLDRRIDRELHPVHLHRRDGGGADLVGLRILRRIGRCWCGRRWWRRLVKWRITA